MNHRIGAVCLVLGVLSCSSDPSGAANPCPPPANGVLGGSSATTSCTPVTGERYATEFPLAENPLSEGGKWVNGAVAGFDWHDVQSAPGEAFAAQAATGYNDSIAVLATAFKANQYAQGTVSRTAGYSPGVSHEIELLLRFRISSHVARGYEVLWGHGGELNVVRWNGPLGNYTPLAAVTGPNIGPAVDGDVLRAEIVGNVIRVFKNGQLVYTAPPNDTWTDGQPGIGFWPKPGATLKSYGWRNFEAGSL